MKIVVYRFLISLLVSELLRFIDLKNDGKNGTRDCAVPGEINQKLIKSVNSGYGHLVLNNPKIYYITANKCLNCLKL